MVEKAEAQDLEFDAKFLSYYRPCFNGTLNDSMTLGYRVLGQYVRPIGTVSGSGESLHRAVVDRLNQPTTAYQPKNLPKQKVAAMTVVNTSRVARGTPC
jgi:hypothetical protein